MAQRIKVAAGVLIKNNHVLITSRPKGKVCEGSWEFPGGKIEDGETPSCALIRELQEEIGINVDAHECKILTQITQVYPHADVELYVIRVDNWQGEINLLEDQEMFWQDLYRPCTKEPLLITTQKILDIIVSQ